ncbi:MAG: hypothetical protein M1839_006377 [Geoglossum umbratile]|nr:MAG: hypothetical protein M1839_006377 [Geoglossum umbratile]
MEQLGPSDKPYKRMLLWDKRFQSRQKQAYGSEDVRHTTASDSEDPIESFLTYKLDRLDPPQYTYRALLDFLNRARLVDLTTNIPPTERNILVDDRRDLTDTLSTRNWDKYVSYPPEGESRSLNLLNERELYVKLCEKRAENGAERRTIFITNMTPSCALALVATASILQTNIVRDFLRRYISYRSFWGVTAPFGFGMEFHLSYFALRKGNPRACDPRGMRRRICRSLLFAPKYPLLSDDECIHEVQTSFLVTGVDEWFWTAYCCTETYFGETKDTAQGYFTAGLDPSSGGASLLKYPVWNPREYFLGVLRRRIKQAMKEWSSVVFTVEKRLAIHDEYVFGETLSSILYTEDDDFSSTKEFSWTTQVLWMLHNSLTQTIESWESFESIHRRYFDVREQSLQAPWETYLVSIDKDVTELKLLRRALQQKIEMFDNIRRSFQSATALGEARIVTTQGKSITMLTMVTIVYLPLSLVTTAFSMTVLPKGASLKHYFILLSTFTTATLSVVFSLNKLRTMWEKRKARRTVASQNVKIYEA